MKKMMSLFFSTFGGLSEKLSLIKLHTIVGMQ
jgi:hypothetical protein